MMKKIAFAALVVAIAFSALAKDARVVKRGAAIAPDAKAVTVAQLMQSPDDYAKDPVVVEGTVSSVCTNMGCWMQLGDMHVTFKDGGFFVPTTSKGLKARAQGVVEVKTFDKDEADHLAGEGATLHRNADGTAKEVTFVASGVELRK